MLQEPPYNRAAWQALSDAKSPADVKAATAYPTVQVVIGARKDFLDQAPNIHQFLRNYRSSAQLVSEALAYMQDSKGSAADAARYFLRMHEEQWRAWVPAEVAARVKARL
jgi:ABC-type proline/glycine betaine transport system substrate-binding protein